MAVDVQYLGKMLLLQCTRQRRRFRRGRCDNHQPLRTRIAQQAHDAGVQGHPAAAAGAAASGGDGDLCCGKFLCEMAAVVVEQRPRLLARTRREQGTQENGFRVAVDTGDEQGGNGGHRAIITAGGFGYKGAR